MNKFDKTYLELLNADSNKNIISEEYHNAPFGWSKNYFGKVMIAMIKHTIKKFAYKEFDDFFLSDKLYSFKNLFKTDPKVSVAGAGKSFSVILNYEIDVKDEESDKILIGKEGSKHLKNGKTQKSGVLSRLFGKLGKNDRGILWNFAFLDFFVKEGLVEKNDKDELAEEDINDIFLKTYLKTVISEDAETTSAPFVIDQANPLKLAKIGVTFEFNKINYCEGCKRKDYINANRVTGMNGIAYLKFFPNKGSEFTIPVTDENGITWTQYRTENMNPPKPIKDEIKKIWNNPNEGFGLLGLGLKKLGGALSAAAFGGGLSSKIADEDFECTFKSMYSINNSVGIAVKGKKDEEGGPPDIEDGIENALSSKSGTYLIWNVKLNTKEKGKKVYECVATYDTTDIIKIKIELE